MVVARSHPTHRTALGLDPRAALSPAQAATGPRVKPEDGPVSGRTWVPTYPLCPPLQNRAYHPPIFRDAGGAAATSVRKPAGGVEVALRSGSSGRGMRAGATVNAGVCDPPSDKVPTPRGGCRLIFNYSEAIAVSGSARCHLWQAARPSDNRITGGACPCPQFRRIFFGSALLIDIDSARTRDDLHAQPAARPDGGLS